ncbi:hypothetical protein JCM33374_g4359 [Metschnikowia sp. JCM 33374]|nr:hypothetical protein JCM33374_g4359 [Metschnikowia sp. JCM 33374]
MTDVFKDDTIAMFFNEDFSPENYVDALYSSLSGPTDRYSPQTLSKINTSTQDLLTHLDYNTNVLLHELEKKMDQLKKSSSTIGVSEYVSAEENTGAVNADTSRLQYYVDSLKNAVETLSSDVETVRREAATSIITEQHSDPANGDPIGSLISLKEVKASILKVYHVIQNARRKVGGSAEVAVSDEEFSAALSSLHESLRNRLREGTNDDRVEVTETVKELRSWVPMFQPFTRFGPVFVKFVVKLENEL